MENQQGDNLQIILYSEPVIREWFDHLMARGRKYNVSFKIITNKVLEFSNGDHKEEIRLDEGLEEIKSGLQSLKDKYPISLFAEGVEQ